MTRDLSPGTVRVIVYVAEVAGSAFAEVPAVQLQRWLGDLDDLTDRPLRKGTIDGAQRAVRIFDVSASAGEHLVACLAAVWIVLHGPRYTSGPELCMDDIQEGGDCTLTVRVSGDRCRWGYTLIGDRNTDTKGGKRNVPGRDFDTVGSA